MQKDIDHITENISDIKSYIKEDRAWKENFTQCLDRKYSAKWVETVSLTALAGIIVGVVLIILGK